MTFQNLFTKTQIQNKMTTKLISVSYNDSLVHARDLMNKHNIRHLPVVDESQQVVGVISDRDLNRGLGIVYLTHIQKKTGVISLQSQTDFMPDQVTEEKWQMDSKVFQFMSWPVQYIDAKAELSQAARIMIEEKISCLLVTDRNQVVGIITQENLMKVLLEIIAHPQTDVLNKIQNWASHSAIGDIAMFLSQAGI